MVWGTRPLRRPRGGDSARLQGPRLPRTPRPAPLSTPRPTHYLDGASRRQVAHVIEGSHLRLGLLLEVQLLTFDLDITSTWNQNSTGHRGWQRNVLQARPGAWDRNPSLAEGWLRAQDSSGETGPLPLAPRTDGTRWARCSARGCPLWLWLRPPPHPAGGSSSTGSGHPHAIAAFRGGPLTVPGARGSRSPGQRDNPRLTGRVPCHSLSQRGQDPRFRVAGTGAGKRSDPPTATAKLVTDQDRTGGKRRVSEPFSRVPLSGKGKAKGLGPELRKGRPARAPAPLGGDAGGGWPGHRLTGHSAAVGSRASPAALPPAPGAAQQRGLPEKRGKGKVS